MVVDLSWGHALLWVLVAVAAAVGILWADSRRRFRGALTLGVTVAALVAAYAASGLSLALLKPRRLDELGAGLSHGAESLASVQMPYRGADPWPSLTLQLLGALLCVLAALLAFWPRGNGVPRLPVPRARAAARPRRRAGRLDRRDAAGRARARPDRADRLLPLARAAAAAAGARDRGDAGAGAGRRAAARERGERRAAVVRLQGVRREPRSRRPGPVQLEPHLRRHHLAARRRRGAARRHPPARRTGRSPTSTTSTARRGSTRAATGRARPRRSSTCPTGGRAARSGATRCASPCGGSRPTP